VEVEVEVEVVVLVLVGNKVVDPDCMAAVRVDACVVEVCRIDEKVVDAALRVSVDLDDAVCTGTNSVEEEEVVTPWPEWDERGVEE
jgi:hypothetical protein